MRRAVKAVKYALALALLASYLPGLLNGTASASRSGVTVTPGTLTLILASNASEQSGEFTLTNQYDKTITLRFAFEPRLQPAGQQSNMPSEALTISRTELTLAPSQSATQKVTLRDQQLSPGSHLADLVIMQGGGQDSGVGIEPSIRVPLTILKQDGAVTKMDVSEFSTSAFSFSLPNTLVATIHNSGNVIVIPRGVVTVSKLDGTVVRSGVLNTGSTAISPEGKLTISTPLTSLAAKPFFPGIYRAAISYGPGGDAASASGSRTFVYAAWWHVVVLIAIIIASLYLIKYRRRQMRTLLQTFQKKHTTGKKTS